MPAFSTRSEAVASARVRSTNTPALGGQGAMTGAMLDRDTRVIGYFACLSPGHVVCTDVDACVVSGSRRAMEEYLSGIHPRGAHKATVRKTRFGEIVRGLELGAAYGFDQESYARFYPLALDAGIPVAPADFEAQRHEGARFFTVRLTGSWLPRPAP